MARMRRMRGRRFKGRRSRKAGMSARRLARRVYRKALRMPKKKLAKTYAAKVGKSRWKRIMRRW